MKNQDEEKEIIGIDQQIEAVTDILPIIDKDSKPVFEEILKSLKFFKENEEKSNAALSDEVIAEFEKPVSEMNPEILEKFHNDLKMDLHKVPEWMRNNRMFEYYNYGTVGAYKARNIFRDGNEEVVESSYNDIATELFAGKRFIKKFNHGHSGVRHFHIGVMTSETYPEFKKLKCSNEEARDSEYNQMLQQSDTLEYPEVEDK